jgi:hypothetical protein
MVAPVAQQDYNGGPVCFFYKSPHEVAAAARGLRRNEN